jgi:hypothetical protein
MPPEALAKADALVQRAEQLFPALKRLETAKARLNDVRSRAGR